MFVVQPVVEAQKQTEEYRETEQQTRVLDWGASEADGAADKGASKADGEMEQQTGVLDWGAMQAKQVGVLDQSASGADGGIHRDRAADKGIGLGCKRSRPRCNRL